MSSASDSFYWRTDFFPWVIALLDGYPSSNRLTFSGIGFYKVSFKLGGILGFLRGFVGLGIYMKGFRV